MPSSMVPLLLVTGCIATSFTHVTASPTSHVGDASVMLQVRSFTIVEPKKEIPHEAVDTKKDEILSMVSEDLKEIDDVLLGKVAIEAPKLSTVAEDLQELDELLAEPELRQPTPSNQPEAKAPSEQKPTAVPGQTNVTLLNSTITVAQDTDGHSRLFLWSSIGCGLLLACVCSHCLTGRHQERQEQNGEESLVEVWEKHTDLTALTAIFKELDEVEQSNNSPPGYITSEDLKEAMQDDRLAGELARLHITQEYCEAVFDRLDKKQGENAGLVSLEEFLDVLASARFKAARA